MQPAGQSHVKAYARSLPSDPDSFIYTILRYWYILEGSQAQCGKRSVQPKYAISMDLIIKLNVV